MSSDVRLQQDPRRGVFRALLAALGLALGVGLAGCYVAPAPGSYHGGGPGYYGPSASIYFVPRHRYRGYHGHRGHRSYYGHRSHHRCWWCW